MASLLPHPGADHARVALFFALALDSGMLRLSKVFRLGIFVPYAVPAVVATLMWGYLYGPDFGPFAQLPTRSARPRRSSSTRHLASCPRS